MGLLQARLRQLELRLLALGGGIGLGGGGQGAQQLGQRGFAGTEGLVDVGGALAQQAGALALQAGLGLGTLQLRLGLDNITNQKVVETQSNNPYMQNVMEYGRRYNLGLSYKF